jgi:hypothetical protein
MSRNSELRTDAPDSRRKRIGGANCLSQFKSVSCPRRFISAGRVAAGVDKGPSTLKETGSARIRLQQIRRRDLKSKDN